MSDRLLDRAALHALLVELAERLARRDVRANVYVIGGAAIAMQFDERRATRDIDSVVLSGHGPLFDEVRSMARRHGLPTTWLVEQAASYVASVADRNSSTVFDHPHLSVAAASAEHLLAMKMLAARASDVPDLRLLLTVLGITEIAQAESNLADIFPGSSMTDRARLMIEDLLAERAG